MNVSCLIQKLNEIGVPKQFYTINGDLSPDTYVLNQVYGKWECFYYDEKGNYNEYRTFENENDACIHMFGVLENEMKFW